MRLIHAADIHLDSPLRGLSRFGEDTAHELRSSTRIALENLVAHTVETAADLLVIAGDLYDGNWDDYGTGAFFRRQMEVLSDAGIPVVVIRGNHDAESQITRALRLPDNVQVVSSDACQSLAFDDIGVVVHGRSYATRAVYERMAAEYPARVDGRVNIGILHTSGMGYAGHDPYAPASPEELRALEYEYLALGHVHQRQAVLTGERPAWFSGNLQGRHVNESGPKGALQVELTVDEAATVSFVPLDVARWETVAVDVTDATSLDDVLDRVDAALDSCAGEAAGRRLVTRVDLRGQSVVATVLQDVDRLRAEVDGLAERHRIVLERVNSSATVPAAPDPDAARLREAVRRAASTLLDEPTRATAHIDELDVEIRTALLGRDRSGLGVDTDVLDPEDLVARAAAALDARLAGLGD